MQAFCVSDEPIDQNSAAFGAGPAWLRDIAVFIDAQKCEGEDKNPLLHEFLVPEEKLDFYWHDRKQSKEQTEPSSSEAAVKKQK
eukprot:3233500-Lingulodinium_polyedra.AAC.1